MLDSWLKLHNTFEEEPGEDLTHIGVLILSGNVKWLILFIGLQPSSLERKRNR